MSENNRLCELKDAGQSVWLDFITREMVRSEDLRNLIENECVCGLTTNPTIFDKAISGSSAYDEDIMQLGALGLDTHELYHRLMLDDALGACRTFYPLYEQSDGQDGMVSVEVSPEKARDTIGTINEARELVEEAGHQANLMIKVPGTVEGLKSIRKLVSEGFNINVTLIFSVSQYRAVVNAYMGGLEDRQARGVPIDNLVSVASLFVSRIDTMVDPLIDDLVNNKDAAGLKELRGNIGIATARHAYEVSEELLANDRWQNLAGAGAQPQRLLWGSTGTKDAAYSDVKYVEALIGPDTVNTIPLATLRAFADHGRVEQTLRSNPGKAAADIQAIRDAGIDMDRVYSHLLQEGVEKFTDSYRSLIKSLNDSRGRLSAA